MRRWLAGLLVAPVVVCLPSIVQAREQGATVLRAIDGDTIEIGVAGKIEKVRLIGVDTPETVDPRKPVEFFGNEASEFAGKLVEGKKVVLRDELGGQDRDKYGRLLRYVYLEDGTFVNAEIIRQGYGHAYVVFPFSHMEEFRAYEWQAREKGLGLWGSTETKAEPGRARAPTGGQIVGSSQSNKYHLPTCVWAQKISPANLVTFKSPEVAQSRGYAPCKVCNPSTRSAGTELDQVSNPKPATGGVAPEKSETARGSAPEQIGTSATSGGPSDQDVIVYVTRTGSKYHRAGCRYLSKSMIPMPLKEAAQRYAPCSVCRPPLPKTEQ
jgi:micrococcal nuclease